jgi:hypothetical protein
MNLVGLNEMPYWGLDGLRHELRLSPTKKMTRVIFGTIVQGIIPLKSSMDD